MNGETVEGGSTRDHSPAPLEEEVTAVAATSPPPEDTEAPAATEVKPKKGLVSVLRSWNEA